MRRTLCRLKYFYILSRIESYTDNLPLMVNSFLIHKEKKDLITTT